jgi:ADP-heptose:LPS heptosyltransferase
MVVALPCFHTIRRRYSDRKIVLLTNEPVAESAASAGQLLLGSGLCDEVLGYQVGLRDPRRLFRLWREISSRHFEAAFDLNSISGFEDGDGVAKCIRNYCFLKLCGIRVVVGSPRKRSDRAVDPGRGEVVRESLRLLKRIGGNCELDLADRTVWSLGLKSGERDLAAALLSEANIGASFAVVSIGTKSIVKDWGDSNWRSLLEDLSAQVGGLSMVAIGAASEFSRTQELLAAWRGPTANLCGKCQPRISAAVLERAALFIGHDSGPMHLAAAVGTPDVAIFSWHNPPGLWFPGHASWRNVRVFYPDLGGRKWTQALRDRRGEREGIMLIEPRDVAEACCTLLGGSDAMSQRGNS